MTQAICARLDAALHRAVQSGLLKMSTDSGLVQVA
jgi:hypothetical protein